METRWAVLALVLIVTAVLLVRGVVAVGNGEFGTVARQLGVGAVVFAFGISLVRYWDNVGG